RPPRPFAGKRIHLPPNIHAVAGVALVHPLVFARTGPIDWLPAVHPGARSPRSIPTDSRQKRLKPTSCFAAVNGEVDANKVVSCEHSGGDLVLARVPLCNCRPRADPGSVQTGDVRRNPRSEGRGLRAVLEFVPRRSERRQSV